MRVSFCDPCVAGKESFPNCSVFKIKTAGWVNFGSLICSLCAVHVHLPSPSLINDPARGTTPINK